MSILAVLASQTNPLVPTAWEGIGAGSAIAYLVLAAWFVPLLGAILVLITAYRQPKPQTTCPWTRND